jgi:hypothetical protein
MQQKNIRGHGDGCPVAFEQAVQRGKEGARFLGCHDVSMMIGTRTGVIG